MSNLEFGFGREDITPAYGVALCGYFNARPNKGAYDRLSVKAAVFRTGDELAAIVSYDLCLLSGTEIQQIADEVVAELPQFKDNTLYCCTHTHTGPYTSALFGADHVDAEYMVNLRKKTVFALKQAYRSLAPAELFAAETECTTLAFNRRFVMKNGKTLTNPGKLNPEIDRPEGGVDHKIIMIEVRQNGHPALMIANISNHTDTIGGDWVSADWPGVMEKEVQYQRKYDIPVMTIIAPQGNINHFNVKAPGTQTSYAEAQRIGKAYAAELLAALYRLSPMNDVAVKTAMTEIEAPYYQLSDEEYAAAQKDYEDNKDAVMESGRDFTSEDIARGVPFVKKYFAQRALACRDNPKTDKRIEKQIVISFNPELAIVSLPAEPFVELGFAIREKSPYPLTVLAALGMGEIGYVGLKNNYGNGGYETSPSNGLADPAAGEAIIAGAIKLLNN